MALLGGLPRKKCFSDSVGPTLKIVVAECKKDRVWWLSATRDLFSQCVMYRDRVGVERGGRICKQYLPSKNTFFGRSFINTANRGDIFIADAFNMKNDLTLMKVDGWKELFRFCGAWTSRTC